MFDRRLKEKVVKLKKQQQNNIVWLVVFVCVCVTQWRKKRPKNQNNFFITNSATGIIPEDRQSKKTRHRKEFDC